MSKTKFCTRNKEKNVNKYHYGGDAIRIVSVRLLKIGIFINTNFRRTIKSYLTNKGILENPELKFQDQGNTVSHELLLVKAFNKHFVNIAEKSWRNSHKSYK